MLPSFEKIVSVRDLDSLHSQVGSLEKTVLKGSRHDRVRYCENLFSFVFFRFELHKTSVSVLLGVPSAEAAKRASFGGILEQNVLSSEELFTEAEKECPLEGVSSDTRLMARFANAWLLDNFQTRLTPVYDPKKLDKQTERIFSEYDFVLKEFRSRSDKNWIDPVLLLYSYANSLLRKAQFETAEPLLSECVELAGKRYGVNSPVLLPALRLLAGIADAAGNRLDHERFTGWMIRIEGGTGEGKKILFNLKGRATPESMPLLDPGKIVIVMGTRDGVEGRLNKRFPDRDVNEDLPRQAGQQLTNNSIVGMSSGGGRPISVFISVDEAGNVTEAEVRSSDEKIRAKLKKIALGLEFRPMTNKGRITPMKGFVYLFIKREYWGMQGSGRGHPAGKCASACPK